MFFCCPVSEIFPEIQPNLLLSWHCCHLRSVALLLCPTACSVPFETSPEALLLVFEEAEQLNPLSSDLAKAGDAEAAVLVDALGCFLLYRGGPTSHFENRDLPRVAAFPHHGQWCDPLLSSGRETLRGWKSCSSSQPKLSSSAQRSLRNSALSEELWVS